MQALARAARRRFAAVADDRTTRKTQRHNSDALCFSGRSDARGIGRRSRPTCGARSPVRAFALFAAFAFGL